MGYCARLGRRFASQRRNLVGQELSVSLFVCNLGLEEGAQLPAVRTR
jgi:hypothetical protein